MLLVISGTRQGVNAQLIKRKIKAQNLPRREGDIYTYVTTDTHNLAKVIAWFAEPNSSLLFYSSKD